MCPSALRALACPSLVEEGSQGRLPEGGAAECPATRNRLSLVLTGEGSCGSVGSGLNLPELGGI